jgi:hypothetical protein
VLCPLAKCENLGIVRNKLGGALFIFFDCREALVEGKGLLDKFQALNNALMTNAIGFFDGVKPFIHSRELAAHLPQLRREKILYNLASFFDDAHENTTPIQDTALNLLQIHGKVGSIARATE